MGEVTRWLTSRSLRILPSKLAEGSSAGLREICVCIVGARASTSWKTRSVPVCAAMAPAMKKALSEKGQAAAALANGRRRAMVRARLSTSERE
eukprot:scaffold13273_cov34-Tisochrysis_lutea.AAC.1